MNTQMTGDVENLIIFDTIISIIEKKTVYNTSSWSECCLPFCMAVLFIILSFSRGIHSYGIKTPYTFLPACSAFNGGCGL